MPELSMEALFVVPSARSRHEAAPLWPERERYLLHLLRQGSSQQNVRSAASTLLQVVRLLELSTMRTVDCSEIEAAARIWATEDDLHLTRKPGKRSFDVFCARARAWLRFHGQFTKGSPGPFTSLLSDFSSELRDVRGVSPDTVHGYSSRSKAFLDWLPSTHESLSSVSVKDVDAYFDAKRAGGWRPITIKSSCQALRSLFGYAELRGWCGSNLASGIRCPPIPKYQGAPKGPSWREVRRLIRSTSGNQPADILARAIVLLCSVYALRNSEVTRMRLEDLDWQKETLTVKRLKSGKIQQFPIQPEVGEAILRYLEEVRPRCACHNVFVTTRRPYRPILKTTLGAIVAKRMKQLHIQVGHLGPHSLRHACATRLLNTGSSLQEIADFLGHSDAKTVSIYARLDLRSLSKVSAFSLAWTR
jgi:integrase/recombinase XerD